MSVIQPYLPRVKTFEEWAAEGYMVMKGQKSTGRNHLGKATFHEDQVKHTGISRTFPRENTWNTTPQIDVSDRAPVPFHQSFANEYMSRPWEEDDTHVTPRRNQYTDAYNSFNNTRSQRAWGVVPDSYRQQITQLTREEVNEMLGVGHLNRPYKAPAPKKPKQPAPVQDESGIGDFRNISL